MLGRNRETEHAQLRHLGKHVERNVTVGKMPFLRLRHDFAVGELAHLMADRREHAVEPAVTDCGVVVSAHQLHQAGAPLDVAGNGEALERAGDACGDRREREADIGRTNDLALAHRNAALDLGEIFADPDFDQQLLHLTETATRMHALGIGCELAHRFHIGGEPGKTVGGALLTFDQTVHHLAFGHDAPAHAERRLRQQVPGGARGLARQRNQRQPSLVRAGLVQHRLPPSGGARGSAYSQQGRTSREFPERVCARRRRVPSETLRVHCTKAMRKATIRPVFSSQVCDRCARHGDRRTWRRHELFRRYPRRIASQTPMAAMTIPMI